MAGEPTHIRGDTFTVTGQFTGGNFTGWTGRSQVRSDDKDDLLSELTFTWSDASQGLFYVSTNMTSNWPHSKYVIFDVQITSPDGQTRSSPLVKILVQRDATYA